MYIRSQRLLLCSKTAWVVLFLSVLGLLRVAHADQSIILRSGNGVVGKQDAQVRFIHYAVGQDIPPTASDFAAAQAGTYAYIDAPYSTYMTPAQFSDPLAQWIGTSSSLAAGSALYAIPFKVTDPIIAAASLSLGYSVDNAVHGIYLNGTEISNFVNDGDYHGEYYTMRSDIAPLLVPGATNWLYIKTYDTGGYAGLIFTANIVTQGTAPGAPTITPNQGGNAGSVSFQIIGTGFEAGTSTGASPAEAGPTVTLTGTGSTVTATNVTVISPNVLTGTFDLTKALPGLGTVKVTNRDSTSITLNNAFTVSTGGAAQLSIQKIGNEAVAGYNESYFITVTNTGGVDSSATAVNELLEPWFAFNSAQPTPAKTASLPDPTSSNVNDTYISTLQWSLPSIAPGSTANLTYSAKINITLAPNSVVRGPACLEDFGDVCYDSWLMCQDQVYNNKIGGVPAGCANSIVPIFAAPACVGAIAGCTVGYLTCEATIHVQCATASNDNKAAKDPNYITGPSGFSGQGWFKPPAFLQYSLSYENEATATKAATNVYLSDTFDPAVFDLSTLRIGSVVIGAAANPAPTTPLIKQPFAADIDLRPSQPLIVRVNASIDPIKGTVNASLVTLDPTTGLAPTDPTIGFLAPGADSSILFTVSAKAPISTGNLVQDAGSVVFDFNAPINTNTWLNTVDITPPTSRVTSLPTATTNPSLNVAWSGTDVGSGIQYYSVYVSDNGGAYTEWQSEATSLSATYTGTVGHTYAFYSIATDDVSNIEATKTSADTTVQVVPVIGTTATVSASANPANAGASVTFTASVTPASGTGLPTGTVTFSDGSTQLGTGALNASAQATYSTSALAVGSHSITAVYGGDSNYTGSTSTALTETVATPSFTMSVSPNTVSISGGQAGQTTVTITPMGGFSAAISLSCSGQPANSTCTVSPGSVTPNGSNAAITSTVSIATNVKSASVAPHEPLERGSTALALLMMGVSPLWFIGNVRKRQSKFLLVLLASVSLGAVALMSGCGSSGPITPKGNSTVTVTATSGSVSQTSTFTLTIQ